MPDPGSGALYRLSLSLLLALSAAAAGAQTPETPRVSGTPQRGKPDAPAVKSEPRRPVAGPQNPACAFDKSGLPGEFVVLVAAGYRGRKLDFQIDQTGHPATQVDVAVNHKGKPVVLLLGAYEPTIWNIGWTRGTRIRAVVVAGHHRQVIAGLAPKVPRMISSRREGGPCHAVYNANAAHLDWFAQWLFGRPIDARYPVRDGAVTMGEALFKNRPLETADLVRSSAVPAGSFRKPASTGP